MLKKFKDNDIQQCHFLNNKNNIKLYYTYKKNKYFINLEKNTSTQSFILEINSAERSFSTVKLTCYNSKSELVTVMLPKYVSALLAEKIDLHGYNGRGRCTIFYQRPYHVECKGDRNSCII